jgi:rhodanese-related sulfurtransferase
MTKPLDENQLNHISPTDSYEILQRDSRALFIDIRSNMEFLFVGHPKGAIHLPWIDEPDWTVNKNFVKEIRQLLLGGVSQDHASPPIILICRSGKRSKDAGEALIQAGIKNVCHVSEGFEGDLDEEHHRSATGGWRFRGLPWEQC